MKKVTRRLLAFLLCFAMILTIAPASVYAAEPGDDEDIVASNEEIKDEKAEIAEETDDGQYYPCWVNGIQISSSNLNDVLKDGGSVVYSPANAYTGTSAKLTLTDAVIESGIGFYEEKTGIYAEQDIDIILNGDNRIGTIPAKIADSSDYSVVYGIGAGNYINDWENPVYYNCSLSGTGSLFIYDIHSGIFANKIKVNLTGKLKVVEFGELRLACCLKAMSTADDAVIVNSGLLELSSYTSECVYGQMTVNGGSLDMVSYGHVEVKTDTPIDYAVDHVPQYGKTYDPVIKAGKDSSNMKTLSATDKAIMTNYVKISPKIKFNVYINPMTHGTVLAGGGTHAEGDKVQLLVYPDAGYRLDSLTVNYGLKGSVDVNMTDYTFVMPSESAVVNATFKEVPKLDPVKPEGISILSNNASGMKVKAVLPKGIDESQLEICWAASTDGGKTYCATSPFAFNNGTFEFRTEKKDYTIYLLTKVNQDEATIEQYEAMQTANIGIKGICQMPNPNGSGYLIGIEGKDDPNHEYYYELLILDCTKYAQGLPAWVATTGKRKTGSNCCWMKWDPQYGYYWTLFRLYDKDMNLVDEECYGFANI